jgi:integrase
MANKNTTGYTIRGDKLYVQGSIDGNFKRYSTGLKATSQNIKFIKKHCITELQRIHNKKNEVKTISTKFVDYALSNLELNEAKRTESTAKEYMQIFNTRIKPYFENFDLSDIKRYDLQKWQKDLKDTGLSGKRVNNIRSVFSFILEEARKDELIDKNYFTIIDREKVEDYEINPFSFDEAKLILSKVSGWQKDFFQISFFTGMRTGELMALKWDDINFISKTITIRRSIRKGVLRETTKTGKSRTIDMLPIVEDAILRAKQRTYLRNSFLFLSSTGSCYTDAGFIRKGSWSNTLKLCGLDYRTLYQTRHTFASNMISAGEDILWVSQMLGHKNLQMTLSKYTKFIKTNKVKRATFLDNFAEQSAQNQNCADYKVAM